MKSTKRKYILRAVLAGLLCVALVTGVTPAFAGEIPVAGTDAVGANEMNLGATGAANVNTGDAGAANVSTENSGEEDAGAANVNIGDSGAANMNAEDPGAADVSTEVPGEKDVNVEDADAVRGAESGEKGKEDSAGDWTPEQPLPAIASLKLTIVNNTIVVQWAANQVFDGYEICYARNVLYLRNTSVMVPGGETAATTLDGLETSKRYYVRVRGYKDAGETRYYSDWISKNTSAPSIIASVLFVKKDGKKVDVRKMAGKKLNGYSISQGTCCDGSHLYMCFEKRNGDSNGKKRARVKIAKVRIADWKLLKVSRSLKLGHANDITFNGNRDILVVTRAKTNDPYVSIVSPTTLKKTGTEKIKLLKPYKGVRAFNAIDYDPDTRTYYIRSRNYGGKSFTLNENFKMLSVATAYTVYPTRSVQSCAGVQDKFIIPQSWNQSSSKNTITIFSKAGQQLQHIQLKVKGELESVFMIGGELYATVHKHCKKGYKTGYIFKILF